MGDIEQIITSIAFSYHEDELRYDNEMELAIWRSLGTVLLMGQGGDVFIERSTRFIRQFLDHEDKEQLLATLPADEAEEFRNDLVYLRLIHSTSDRFWQSEPAKPDGRGGKKSGERFDYTAMKSVFIENMLFYARGQYRAAHQMGVDIKELCSEESIVASILSAFDGDDGRYDNDLEKAMFYTLGSALLMGQGGDAFDQKAAHNIRQFLDNHDWEQAIATLPEEEEEAEEFRNHLKYLRFID